MKQENIILIGMPGCGKSTIGVLLAKTLGREFVDTDLVIQANERRSLQDIIDADGLARFCEIEERYVLTLSCKAAVIATGGSVVYSAAAMRHLSDHGVVVYLHVPLVTLEERLQDLQTRGVAKPRDLTLADLYDQRRPLYERWAARTVSCGNMSHESVVAAIVNALTETNCA